MSYCLKCSNPRWAFIWWSGASVVLLKNYGYSWPHPLQYEFWDQLIKLHVKPVGIWIKIDIFTHLVFCRISPLVQVFSSLGYLSTWGLTYLCFSLLVVYWTYLRFLSGFFFFFAVLFIHCIDKDWYLLTFQFI